MTSWRQWSCTASFSISDSTCSKHIDPYMTSRHEISPSWAACSFRWLDALARAASLPFMESEQFMASCVTCGALSRSHGHRQLRSRARSPELLPLFHLLCLQIPLPHLISEPVNLLVKPQLLQSFLERKNSSVQPPISDLPHPSPEQHPANTPVTQYVPHHRIYKDT
jgi:hypothetical protein